MTTRDIVDFLGEQSPIPIDRDWLFGRLAYGSYVCPVRRLLYLETPKVACSTIKWCLADLTGRPPEIRPLVRETSLATAIHDRSQHPMASLTTVPFEVAQAALMSPEWTRFCVVRNPYARIYSAWAEKIRELSPAYRRLVREIVDWDPTSAENGSVGFSSFLRYLLTNASKQVLSDAHLSPMSQLLLSDIINYTHILRLEEFPEEFASIVARIAPEVDARTVLATRRTNTSLPFGWRDAYDEESAAAAREIAGADFSVFEYDSESWRVQPYEPVDRAYFEATALSIVQCRNEVIDALWSRIETLESALLEGRRWPASTTLSSKLPPWVALASVDNARGPAIAGDSWGLGGVLVLMDDAPPNLQLVIQLTCGEAIAANWGWDTPDIGKRFGARGNSLHARWSGAGAHSLPVAILLVENENTRYPVITIDPTFSRSIRRMTKDFALQFRRLVARFHDFE